MIAPEILDRYRNLIKNNIKDTNLVISVEPQFNDELNDLHLLWMLNEIETNKEQTVTKKHRWLGYVQGILISKNYTTVADERNATRDLFDGT